MAKNKELPVGNAALLTAALVTTLSFSTASAFSGGAMGNCSGCHNGGAVQSITLSGPTEVMLNATHTYTLTILGSPAIVGGMNVAASSGSLTATDALTALSGGQITNISAKSFSGSSVSWEFDWTAPDVVGAVDLMAFGISADGLGDAFAMVDTAGLTSLSVQVIPIPAALLLFSSGLALLGWMRRRP